MMGTESDHAVKLSDLLERSRAMLAHAEAGNWERVVKEEMACRQLFNTYFSDPSILKDPNGLSQSLQELLKINNSVQKLATNARDQVKSELRTISDGRRAVNAYAQNSR